MDMVTQMVLTVGVVLVLSKDGMLGDNLAPLQVGMAHLVELGQTTLLVGVLVEAVLVGNGVEPLVIGVGKVVPLQVANDFNSFLKLKKKFFILCYFDYYCYFKNT